MSSNPTFLWERLQDKFYRNFEGYPMQWSVKDIDNLDDYIVSSGPCGGAIALTRDSRRISKLTDKSSSGGSGTIILLYSGSGTLLRRIPWDNGRIRGLGWSELEQLIVVSDNGTARCYNDFEGNFNQFSLGKQAEAEGVIECRFYGIGFVALLGNNQFVSITKYHEPHAEVFENTRITLDGGNNKHPASGVNTSSGTRDFITAGKNIGKNFSLKGIKSSSSSRDTATSSPTGGALEPLIPQSYQSWQIIPPDPSIGRSLAILAATNSSIFVFDGDGVKVFKLDEDEITDGKSTTNYVSSIAVSPNGDFIAYYSTSSIDGILGVISADFQTKLSEYKSKSNSASPRQVEWCGNDAVAIVWDDEITLVGPWGGSLNLYFSSTVFVFPEIDGIRTLTFEKHDFFTKVPDSVVDMFKLGSTTPAAILRDCIDQLDRKSSKADENLLIIMDKLAEAVDSCVEAASLEFEPSWQKRLLRAAAFGKAAIKNMVYNSDKYLQISEYLRVLNNVRQFDVGILISYNQLLYLRPQKLIDRLLTRRMHHLAFKCAEYLHLPTENIYVHWAKTKVRLSQDKEDDVLFKEISSRLANIPGISYEEIARAAFDEGRLELAVVLTDREPRRDKQVPLLLRMQQDELALSEAIKSGDSDLVYYVVMMLHRKLPLASFFRLINDRPVAAACFETICSITDPDLLNNFYYQDDRRLDSAETKYKLAIASGNSASGDLDGLIDDVQETKKRYQEIKDRNFEVRALDEQVKLLNLQRQLEQDYDQPFVGFTVIETISALVKMAQTSRSIKVKDEFKISDKRYWWIRLQALISRHDWDGLHKFATSKKSPIGYEPFYNECLKAGSKRNAALYISHCTNLSYQRRIEMCVEVDDIRRAANEATNAKDINALEQLKKLATPAIATEINTAIAGLQQK